MQDAQYDDIAEKFSRNIYGTTRTTAASHSVARSTDRVLEEDYGGRKLRYWMPAAAARAEAAIKMAERGHPGNASMLANDRPRAAGGRGKV